MAGGGGCWAGPGEGAGAPLAFHTGLSNLSGAWGSLVTRNLEDGRCHRSVRGFGALQRPDGEGGDSELTTGCLS